MYYNKRWEHPTLSILNLPRRLDRRRVAISTAMWLDIYVGEVAVVNAKDALDYNTADGILQDVVKDGFPQFEHLQGWEDRNLGAVAYAWSLCRYFRDLADSENHELFMHDDMYAQYYSHTHVNKWIIRNFFNYPIFTYCNRKKWEFSFFLLNTEATNLPVCQAYVADEVRVGVDHLNLKAGYFSPKGAKVVLDRLLNQISLGERSTAPFLNALESTVSWEPEATFSTSEQLFVEYPTDFLGSDVRGHPPKQGQFARLFKEATAS